MKFSNFFVLLEGFRISFPESTITAVTAGLSLVTATIKQTRENRQRGTPASCISDSLTACIAEDIARAICHRRSNDLTARSVTPIVNAHAEGRETPLDILNFSEEEIDQVVRSLFSDKIAQEKCEPGIPYVCKGSQSTQGKVSEDRDQHAEGAEIPRLAETLFPWHVHKAKFLTIIALIYQNGERGVRADIQEAIEWFTRAAEQGDPEAQYNLGLIYRDGKNGVTTNNFKAFRLLTQAEEQGYLPAQNNLGFVLFYGRDGVKADIFKTIELFTKAGEQECLPAQNELGWIYQNGVEGVAADIFKAIEWFKRAAKQGYSPAQNNLGFIYQNGINGVKVDTKKGIRLLTQAADQGNSKAQYNLGCIFRDGKNGEKANTQEAIKWFKKAADQGDQEAQFELAILQNCNIM